ncbi:Tpt1/KptA family RNA 2'-phosphotransferase [Xylariales sp. AK1849]|nr:Tpt1/KptA family RNA 2'-phosphotransferase [Xylariales sp. AK1849]
MTEQVDSDAAERLEALAPRGGRNKGAGRRGKGTGGGGAQDREVQISKALSTLLRHQAANAGVKLDVEGFARLDKVIEWQRIANLKPSFAEIQHAVTDNAKQRFSMKPNPEPVDLQSVNPKYKEFANYLIRANQGHSIKIQSEGLHTPITLDAGNIPEVVVHGTYFAYWPKIVETGGLQRMGRTHIHFGTGLPEDGTSAADQQVHDVGDEAVATPEKEKDRPKVISGMRADAEVLVFVDVSKSLEEGDMKWWLSSNGVVLTEGNADGFVPLRYFKEVRGRRQGVGGLWKDGEKVGDLPDGIVARAPQGKTRQGGGGRGGRGGKSGKRSGRGS